PRATSWSTWKRSTSEASRGGGALRALPVGRGPALCDRRQGRGGTATAPGVGRVALANPVAASCAPAPVVESPAAPPPPTAPRAPAPPVGGSRGAGRGASPAQGPPPRGPRGGRPAPTPAAAPPRRAQDAAGTAARKARQAIVGADRAPDQHRAVRSTERATR